MVSVLLYNNTNNCWYY